MLRLKKVTLHDHPLFSLEDLHAAKLKTLFQQYRAMLSTNRLAHLSKQLQSLIAAREARAEAKQTDKDRIVAALKSASNQSNQVGVLLICSNAAFAIDIITIISNSFN